jgi:cytochrome c
MLAGSLPTFERYSDALKSSEIIWNDRSLGGWLTDPERMVPDNETPFDGTIKNASDRADLLAFPKEAIKPGAAPQQNAQAQMGGKGGMIGGMMVGGPDPDLKSRPGQAGQGHHLLQRQLSHNHRQREDTTLLGTQSPLHDQL